MGAQDAPFTACDSASCLLVQQHLSYSHGPFISPLPLPCRGCGGERVPLHGNGFRWQCRSCIALIPWLTVCFATKERQARRLSASSQALSQSSLASTRQRLLAPPRSRSLVPTRLTLSRR